MTEEKRTLIETYLPVVEISEEAKKEKNGRAPTFEMHYWWTRKPLVAARAAVLGALLPSDFDVGEFKRLLGIDGPIETRKNRAHKHDIPLDKIEILKEKYKEVWGEIPTILDPFGGMGSIPFEAMRVGVDAIANDYNPVAHLLQKAVLEYPRKYGEKLYDDVRKGLEWVFEETKNELESYYPKHDGKDVAVYIWAWMVICPKCGFDNPLVGQWWLVRKDKKMLHLQSSEVDGKLHLEIGSGDDVPEGTCSGGKGRCLSCGAVIPNEAIKLDISTREKEELLAVVVNEAVGKSYALPSNEDVEMYNMAKKRTDEDFDQWIIDDLIPFEEMPRNTRGQVSAKLYLTHWHKILNPRQKLLFVTLLNKIELYSKLISEEHDSDYGMAIATYLSFIFGKHIDYSCRAVSWHRSKEIISSALGKRGIGVSWDHCEVNPFVKGSGTLVEIMKAILKGIRYSVEKTQGRGKSNFFNSSITLLNSNADIIVTDPPYYDDVNYAELSEFFFMWEKRAIRSFCEMGDVPKSEDMSVGGCGRTDDFFNKMFKLSCTRMYDMIPNNGLLVMFFAHSSVDAWDFVVNSLQSSGFRISATWPIHTESTTNPLAQGNASIMSSIIIVARKRKLNKSGYIEEIRDDVETHLKKRLEEFWNYGLSGADLTVSAMGATLDIITQYSEIKSYTGEMTVKDVLELVQGYVAEYVLSRFVEDSKGLDPTTAFYLYCRLSGLAGMPFDTANLISKSMNVDIKNFEKLGLISSTTKGKAKGIHLLTYREREYIGLTSLIDAVHLIMNTFEKGGYTDMQREMNNIPYSRTEIKSVLTALLSLPGESDPERQAAQRILERFGDSFPKTGQLALEDFKE